jgi:Na+-translocating ferredoxin:NAD+ oxidoreductase RnfA subunit
MFQKKFVQNINTHISCSITYSENRVIYEAMRDKMAQPDMPQMTL